MYKADVHKMYCAHYHRNAGGWYKGIEVVTTAAIGTSIRTKTVPLEFKNDDMKSFNFKLSRAGFGGVEAGETISGLRICHVTSKKITDEFLTVEDISKEIMLKN